MFKRFWQEESGTTAIEYSILAGMFSVFIVGTMSAVGVEYKSMYSYIGDILSANSVTSATP